MPDIAFAAHFYSISPREVETWPMSEIHRWHAEAVILHNHLHTPPKETASAAD